MHQTQMKIPYGTPPNVLMLGNGFNRAYDLASWDDLIQSIGTRELSEGERQCLDQMPYPLRPIVLTDDQLDTQMQHIAPDLIELRPAEGEIDLIRQYAALPFEAILTTNYTYELEYALHPDFQCPLERSCPYRHITYDTPSLQSIRQLHTYFEGSRPGQSIWHIHGEAARPDTMVLGHYFYGKLLSRMQQYIRILQRRCHGQTYREKGLLCRSWLDYFMLGNVCIVGQGMDLSELDLWWLINCKKRNFPHTRVTLFKPDAAPEHRMLAQAYQVRLEDRPPAEGDYRSYYRCLACELDEKLSKGEKRI